MFLCSGSVDMSCSSNSSLLLGQCAINRAAEGPPRSLSQQQSSHGLSSDSGSNNSEHRNLRAEYPLAGLCSNNNSKSFGQFEKKRPDQHSGIGDFWLLQSFNNGIPTATASIDAPEASVAGILCCGQHSYYFSFPEGRQFSLQLFILTFYTYIFSNTFIPNFMH